MSTRAPMVLKRDPLVDLFSFSILPIYNTQVNRGMSMIKKHIFIVSAEKEKNTPCDISQHTCKSGYERPANPAKLPSMVCKGKGWSFSSQ